MLRNYLLTAYKVLLRRKFFTFVNLFAIALTIGVLTVVFALLQNLLQPIGVERRSDHYLAVENAELAAEDGSQNWHSSPGYRMIERHFLPLQEPDLVAFVQRSSEGTVFVDGRKLMPQIAATDANFWKIMEFEFLSGRGISSDDVEQGRFVAVLNRTTAENIFGSADALGRSLVANGQRFEVIGVVADVPVLRRHAFSEIWIPFSTLPSSNFRRDWMGSFNVFLYAEDRSRLPVIEKEVWTSFESFVHDDPETFQLASAPANSKLASLARELLDRRNERDSGVGQLVAVLIGGILLFMLLPSINLINLNVSRILERSSEIGVRRAFGASSRDLVGQFLIENLVLSLLGGGLGYLLGRLFLWLVEESGMIPYAEFEIDLGVFGLSLLAMLVFGLVSGVYPALKMARLHPVKALRGG
ncbi:MAG: ABC transporter permease [Acidobacteriota bacterium]